MTSTRLTTRRRADCPCVVVIGGGFGGLNAVKALRRADIDVYLIDRENFHLFQPLLYQVATAGLGAEDIASPIRAILARQKNAQIVQGEVLSIDRERQMVHFSNGRIEYDYLIVAAGMENNYFGNQNWEAIAPGLKTLEDALECRRRILGAFERAEWTDDEELMCSLLTFVIVGAGPTGVELAGAIREIAHKVMIRDFRNIDSTQARVLLIDAGPRVLMGYREDLSQRAKEDLEKMGVEIRLNSMVDEITTDGVRIGEEFIKSRTVLWAAGVRASPLAQTLDTELDSLGRVVVDEKSTLPTDDRVFVIGDLAHQEAEEGQLLPALAPVAIQQGKHAARNIRRSLRGETYLPFEYSDRGKMATLGRARAIAEIGGRAYTGLLAWLMWLFIHLLFLIGFRNKVFVVMDWFYAYVGMRRSARLILGTPSAERRGLLEGEILPTIEVSRRVSQYDDEDLDDAAARADGRGPLGGDALGREE